MIRFEQAAFFYLLALIPLLTGLFVLANILSRRLLLRFAQKSLMPDLAPRLSAALPAMKFALLMAALIALIFSAVNPQVGSRLEEAQAEGVDLILALDVSRSMLARDVHPNRLERSRLSAGRLIDQLENDRIGIIAFAGHAITQVPLTHDHHAARMILRTLNTGSVQVQGTSIGSAIERARIAFEQAGTNNGILIIVSDGENHLDDPVESAHKAHAEGMVIHTIGVGSPEGAPIPLYQNGQVSGFLRDQEGQTVVSRYDRQTLENIARAGGGSFRHGGGGDLGLSAVLEEIRGAEKTLYDRMRFSEYESRFHWFAALALILLCIECLIPGRKIQWIIQWNPL